MMDIDIKLDFGLLLSIQGILELKRYEAEKNLRSGLYAAHVEDGYRKQIAEINDFLARSRAATA